MRRSQSSAAACKKPGGAPGAEVKTTASAGRRRRAAPRPQGHRIGGAPSGRRRGSRRRRRPRRTLVEAVGARAVVLHRDPLPRHPSASRYCRISAAVSDSATQSACSPAAWIAPRALGPRAMIRAAAEDLQQLVGQAGGVGGLDPPAEPDAGRTTTMSGGLASIPLWLSRLRRPGAARLSAGACRTAPRGARGGGALERRSAVTRRRSPPSPSARLLSHRSPPPTWHPPGRRGSPRPPPRP